MTVSELIAQLQLCDPHSRVRILVRDSDQDWILYDDEVRLHNCGDYVDFVGINGVLDNDEDDE